MKLQLILAYDGTNYCGWQAQENGKSVQETVTAAACELYCRECLVTGCSRTDSGVHARAYSCTVQFADGAGEGIDSVIPVAAVPRAMNAKLPEDIAVTNAIVVSDDFHPRYGVKSKTYEYVMYDSPVRSPFMRGRAYHVRLISDASLSAMDMAAKAMCGKRDFAAFMASGSRIEDTVRTVYECSVRRDGENIIFRVSADGFLYKMVRTMAGTALAVGGGRLRADDISDIIESKDRSCAGATLPAEGLYLCEVRY